MVGWVEGHKNLIRSLGGSRVADVARGGRLPPPFLTPPRRRLVCVFVIHITLLLQ